MKQPTWLTALILLIGAIDLINGIAMFFAPEAWFYRLVPGVPDTGPFNAHLVADGGTFFIAVGVGLILAARDARRNVIVVGVAAIAGAMHSLLHIWSHVDGTLPMNHMTTEYTGIYIPTAVLIALVIFLSRPEPERIATAARLHAA